ncbi:hypothetical protein [Mycobacterium tuberculosis]
MPSELVDQGVLGGALAAPFDLESLQTGQQFRGGQRIARGPSTRDNEAW